METNELQAAGMNDEQTTCDACGREELRGTVIVTDQDGVEVGRYGTTCASRVLGVKVTRTDVVKRENLRRQGVAREVGAARRALAAGDLPLAGMHVRDLQRFHFLHRADELQALADLQAAVA